MSKKRENTTGKTIPSSKWIKSNRDTLADAINAMEFASIPIADQPTWLFNEAAKKVNLSKKEECHQATAIEDGRASLGTQSYLSLAIDMIKGSGIYAVGALASPLISLVLTPFLTHHLSSINYGALAILYTIIDLVAVVTQIGISPAFFRAYNGDYELSRDRLGVLSASIILLSLISIPLAIAMVIAAPWLSEILFNSPSFTGPVRLTALVVVAENLTVPRIAWLRAEKRAVIFSALSIANLLLVLVTTILLVGVLHMGVNGALLAKGTSYGIIVICTLPVMLLFLARRHCLHLRYDIVRNMLLFGVPTIFSDIAAWILQLSDRYLLSHFASLAQTASYTVSYSLGGVLSPVILAPFGLAWTPVMYAIAKREDATRIFQLVFRWFNTVLLFATFALSLLSTFFLEELFPPTYRSAEILIPFITLSTMLMGIYYIFTIGINIRRKTFFNFIFMAIAATINVILNIYLIPHFGALGAAISTLLAYIVLVLMSYSINQRIYPISFEIGHFTCKLLVGIALYVGGNLLAHTQALPISWSISICSLVLYGIFLAILERLSPKKLTRTFWYVRETLRKG